MGPIDRRGAMSDLVTIGITAFRRPRSLLRLEESIRRSYPELPVVVIETDSNLSRGRNRLARAVATPLLLLCEDDFEFIARTRIEPLVDVLAHDPEIAGVGGELLEPRGPACWAHNFHRNDGEVVARPSIDPLRRTPGGVVYQPCQLIYNFGLFRSELFRQVAWDEEMPLNEHLDYYWRISRSRDRCMAVARGVAILHHKDRPSEEYRAFRRRNFLEMVDARHGAHFRVEHSYAWAEPSERDPAIGPDQPLGGFPRLDRVVRAEFPDNPRAARLIGEFLPHRQTYRREFVEALIAVATSPTGADPSAGPDGAWDVRGLAALMLQHQFLRLPARDEYESLVFLGLLGLLDADQPTPRLSEEVLKEGYTTTEPTPFLREFRRRLGRLGPILSPMGRRRVSPRALRDFIATTRQECKLGLARYLIQPDEVAGRIFARVRRSEGEPTRFKFPYSAGEARRTLARLPGFEAGLLDALRSDGETFWAGDETSARLNALVEQPIGTVVLTIKPPGSSLEIEIKRAGRRAGRPLAIVHDRNGKPVPPSHRLDAGSAADMLQWEAGHAACLAKIYRLVHGKDAPISVVTGLTYANKLPVGDGRSAHLIDYFSDPSLFGDDFPTMRRALSQAVASFAKERGAGVSGLQGDWGETLEFLQYAVPAQSILVGSSSFRLDQLARYLSADGPRYYFEDGLALSITSSGAVVPPTPTLPHKGGGGPIKPSPLVGEGWVGGRGGACPRFATEQEGLKSRPTPGEARRFADTLLEEVLGLYRPPATRYESHESYLDAAFALPENRARADSVHASVSRQLGTFWATFLALRAYSYGESFVARNVGLKCLWERGRWRVRLIFMDHDNLHLPNYEGEVFNPSKILPAMIHDENHVMGHLPKLQPLSGAVDYLQAIYRIDDPTAARHRLLLRESMIRAYQTTQRRLATSPGLRRMIPAGFIAASQAWDEAVGIFLRKRGSEPRWSAEAEAVLKCRGLSGKVRKQYLGALETFAPFLERLAFLYTGDSLPRR